MFKLSMPSPAMVIACVALFVAMGGTGYAATQLANGEGHAVASKKHKGKRGKRGPRGLQGPTGPTGPQGTPGPQGAKGATGATGAAGTALAYALIEAGGAVDPSGSKGITSADVSLDNTGTYCFNKIPAGTKSIVATANGEFLTNANSDRFVSVSFIPTNLAPNWTGCASGSDPVRVTTFDQSVGGLTNSALMIWFEN
jgi:hypothetical protein